MSALPDYSYQVFGLDFSYSASRKITARGWGTALLVSNDDDEFSSPQGSRWGIGLGYDVTSHWRLDGNVEAGSVTQRSGVANCTYSDSMTALELGVQFFYSLLASWGGESCEGC
ncbi:MAG: hypothetical protein GY811_02915 [Myxococcales bacterium]|nr:hypothetical protein [Myxococcales bacterium]